MKIWRDSNHYLTNFILFQIQLQGGARAAGGPERQPSRLRDGGV